MRTRSPVPRSTHDAPPRVGGRARSLVLSLCLALALLQTLGVMHRVVHAPHGADGHATGWLERLFAGHAANGHGCDAYDQASHGDLAGGFAALDVPAVPPAVELPLPHSSWHTAAQARGFLARGPPPLA